MPNLGPRWQLVAKEPLGAGGQGNAFRVRHAQGPDGNEYVAKVLKGAKLTEQSPRWKRLEEEIEVSRSFNHPNVVHVIDSGRTAGSGYPFYVMPFYSGLSLREYRSKLRSPLDVFTLFAGICDGVAYVQSRNIVHRDLKPENIFVDATNGHPIVGDFGLCFRFDAESLTETREVAAARWFGSPELRNGHLEKPSYSADTYSLGKLLYWLFTGDVYDRDEQEYDIDHRKLSQRFLHGEGLNLATNAIEVRDPYYSVRDNGLIHAGAFADDIVSETVRYRPEDRIQYANELPPNVRRAMARFQAGGRALDLRLPQRCLFCASGDYIPLEPLPPADKRLAAADPTRLPSERPDLYARMRGQARHHFGTSDGGQGSVGPLILICNHCGNAQQFRLDLNVKCVRNWK
jgi:serine/threonine protein kinase